MLPMMGQKLSLGDTTGKNAMFYMAVRPDGSWGKGVAAAGAGRRQEARGRSGQNERDIRRRQRQKGMRMWKWRDAATASWSPLPRPPRSLSASQAFGRRTLERRHLIDR